MLYAETSKDGFSIPEFRHFMIALLKVCITMRNRAAEAPYMVSLWATYIKTDLAALTFNASPTLGTQRIVSYMVVIRTKWTVLENIEC